MYNTNLKRAVCVFLICENKFLAVTRKNKESWGLPGGKVDEGESEEQALKREVLEETGLILNDIFPLHVSMCGAGEDGLSFWTTTYFAQIDKETSLRVQEIEKGIVPKWFEFSEFDSELNHFKHYNINVLNAYMNLKN